MQAWSLQENLLSAQHWISWENILYPVTLMNLSLMLCFSSSCWQQVVSILLQLFAKFCRHAASVSICIDLYRSPQTENYVTNGQEPRFKKDKQYFRPDSGLTGCFLVFNAETDCFPNKSHPPLGGVRQTGSKVVSGDSDFNSSIDVTTWKFESCFPTPFNTWLLFQICWMEWRLGQFWVFCR